MKVKWSFVALFIICYQMIVNCYSLSVTCYLWLAKCYLLSKSFHMRLDITCKNLFLLLVVVCHVIFLMSKELILKSSLKFKDNEKVDLPGFLSYWVGGWSLKWKIPLPFSLCQSHWWAPSGCGNFFNATILSPSHYFGAVIIRPLPHIFD